MDRNEKEQAQTQTCNFTNAPSKVVIVGLSTIRRLLNGEDVQLPLLGVILIPDDDLWNAKRRSDWVAAGCPDQRTT